MRNILITNDDGIHADGILRLAKAAAKFGNVYVVAPDSGRSCSSHSLTLNAPMDVYPVDLKLPGVTAYSCTGMPADCVRLGILNLMPEKPSIVLSGVNYGYNMATDIQYSATVGAAFEANFQGYPAIAFSEDAVDAHEVADLYLEEILAKYIDLPFEYGKILNVNFPNCSAKECKGIREDLLVSRGVPYNDTYTEEPLANGGIRFMVKGQWQEEVEEGTDFGAIAQNYVSIGYVYNYH